MHLTPRQEEICGLLRRGMSNKMIAAALGISEGTVKNHVTEILRALNATNRTQAAQHDRTDMFDTEEYMHLALHANAARRLLQKRRCSSILFTPRSSLVLRSGMRVAPAGM